MKISRTNFKGQIISEFFQPVSRAKKEKVIILCQGMPSVPKKDEVLRFLSRKGFWVFFPRYRGTWESRGKFLKKSPHQDILDIISQLPKGFKDSRSGKIIKLNPDKIFLIGSSFGGPAAILASQDKRVDKIVCFSPVIDWKEQKRSGESTDYTEKITKEYFGRAYDFNSSDWKKIGEGNFYNPISEAEKIAGKKIFIIQAKDDKVVPYRSAVKFSRITGAKLKLLSRGGHLGLSFLLKKNQSVKEIFKFLKSISR